MFVLNFQRKYIITWCIKCYINVNILIKKLKLQYKIIKESKVNSKNKWYQKKIKKIWIHVYNSKNKNITYLLKGK